MNYIFNIALITIWFIVTITLCFTGIGIIFIISNEWGWSVILDELIDSVLE